MAGQGGIVEAGTRWGFIPGSQAAGSALYGPQYQGVYGGIAPPDSLKNAQRDSILADMQLKQDKFGLLKGMLGNFDFGGGDGGFSSSPFGSIPAPNYVHPGPVWTQQQIDASGNLARGNLLTQAASQSQQFNKDLAGRGFSPLSPFGAFNNQSNIMRANSAAAANETNLNFGSAKANSDARLQGEGINANLYGDYVKSLSQQNQMQGDWNLKKMGFNFDILRSLLGGLG